MLKTLSKNVDNSLDALRDTLKEMENYPDRYPYLSSDKAFQAYKDYKLKGKDLMDGAQELILAWKNTYETDL